MRVRVSITLKSLGFFLLLLISVFFLSLVSIAVSQIWLSVDLWRMKAMKRERERDRARERKRKRERERKIMERWKVNLGLRAEIVDVCCWAAHILQLTKIKARSCANSIHFVWPYAGECEMSVCVCVSHHNSLTLSSYVVVAYLFVLPNRSS